MKVIVAVVSDLVTDQRVHKASQVLHEQGYEVLLVGRRMKASQVLEPRDYKTYRVVLPFEKGPLFYMSYNIWLFFFLLRHRFDAVLSNDLDTLLASYSATKIKGGQLVYDSHEYFVGVPEIQKRKMVKWVWSTIEQFIFPKLNNVYTVNQSIASMYTHQYHIPVKVVRNVPFKLENFKQEEVVIPQWDGEQKLLIFQGAGINIDRGIEEAIEAMQYLEGYLLLIIGGGDVFGNLQSLCEKFGVSHKVTLLPKMSALKLRSYTMKAALGLSLDKPTNDNYKFSLPNKIFDYTHAGVPVLTSDVIEVATIVRKYQVGLCLESHDPKHIATKIEEAFSDEARYQLWKQNTQNVANECNWQEDSKVIKDIFSKFA